MKIFKKDDVYHDIVDYLMTPNYYNVKTDGRSDEQLDIDRWENDGGRSVSQTILHRLNGLEGRV